MSVYPLTWLADVLRDAGCRVIEEDGWKTRGRDGPFDPRGPMIHHDASPAGETSNGVDVIRDGRPGLEGPLSQLWLSYDGVWHVVAAGRANHAGEGQWHDCPRDEGNTYFIGIETDHTTDEQWTAGQRSAALAGVAALCDRLGIRTRDGLADWFCAHKEYAAGRKVDPDPLDMDYAREQLLAYDAGGLLGMSTLKSFSSSTAQKVRGDGAFKTVTLDNDGALSLLVGPADPYLVTAGFTIDGGGDGDTIEPGDVVQARFQAVIDYEGDKDTVIDTAYPIYEIPVTAGASFANLTWVNKIGGDTGGGKRKLRLFVCPPNGKTLKVTRVAARVLT